MPTAILIGRLGDASFHLQNVHVWRPLATVNILCRTYLHVVLYSSPSASYQNLVGVRAAPSRFVAWSWLQASSSSRPRSSWCLCTCRKTGASPPVCAECCSQLRRFALCRLLRAARVMVTATRSLWSWLKTDDVFVGRGFSSWTRRCLAAKLTSRSSIDCYVSAGWIGDL